MARKKIRILCENIGITTINQELTIKTCRNPKIHDFEDGLQYYSAINMACEVIITEDPGDFYFSEIEVISSEMFLNKTMDLLNKNE